MVQQYAGHDFVAKQGQTQSKLPLLDTEPFLSYYSTLLFGGRNVSSKEYHVFLGSWFRTVNMNAENNNNNNHNNDDDDNDNDNDNNNNKQQIIGHKHRYIDT